jgi:hypothetical protein
MDFEAKVVLTSLGTTGASLDSHDDEPVLHHFDLWYTSNGATLGRGKKVGDLTTWTIYLSEAASCAIQAFEEDATFTFTWGQSLRLVDRATPIGTSLP